MTKPIKITRQAIRETLKQVPIEQILVGAHNVEKVNLTKKQKDFARKVAEGKPKAQAYRETYNTTTNKQSQAEQASRLASNPKVSAMIEAFKVANEAREYLIPAQIRTMAIQNLVSIAINEEEKTSNKLKALELIGKMSEVQLFTERKEHIHLHSSEDIRGKLLAGLKSAFTNSRGLNDLAKRKAESLLVELSEARNIEEDQEEEDYSEDAPAPSEIENPATLPTTDPQNPTNSDSFLLHSIPLKESALSANSLLQDLTPTPGGVTIPLESDTCPSIGSFPNEERSDDEGEGVIISGQSAPDVSHETPPLDDSNEKGVGGIF
jgi:stage V sporulation protein SpoVS